MTFGLCLATFADAHSSSAINPAMPEVLRLLPPKEFLLRAAGTGGSRIREHTLPGIWKTGLLPESNTGPAWATDGPQDVAAAGQPR